VKSKLILVTSAERDNSASAVMLSGRDAGACLNLPLPRLGLMLCLAVRRL